MFDKYTYKQRFIGLLVVLVIFGIIAFQLSIKKTLVLRKQVRLAKGKIEHINSVPSRISYLKEEIAALEQNFGLLEQNNMHQEVLEKASKYCLDKGITVKEYPPSHKYIYDDYLLETHTIIFEGDFFSLLQLVYNFEQQFRSGKIMGVSMKKIKERKTKQYKLYLTIYFQNINLLN